MKYQIVAVMSVITINRIMTNCLASLRLSVL